MTLRILLAEDDAIVRAGLKAILNNEGDIEVVGEAVDGLEAVTLTAALEPDVVVMDIRMPNLDGLAATRQIVANSESAPRVLILTTFEVDEYVFEALRSGASGFLLKRASPEQIVEAIQIVAKGETLLFPSALRQLIADNTPRPGGSGQPNSNLEQLTAREGEVLQLMANGKSNQDIANELFIGQETVKTHVGSVLTKLRVHSRTQAVIMAYESGFVRPGDHQDPGYR